MLEIFILAAGSSSRLGKSKQLLTINKEALVCIVAKVALEVSEIFKLNNPVVVVGKDSEKVISVLESIGVSTIYNPNWQDGMGHSIASAVKNINNDTSAVLFMTCDQVLINCDTLKKFIEYWLLNTNKIVASFYNETIGIPAIFPAKYFPQLSQLSSDKGARGLIKMYSDQVKTFDFPSAAQDLDTLEDETIVQNLLSNEEGLI